MKVDAGNPAENVLPPGVKDSIMEEAVARSGYPVQTEVAIALLDRGLDVWEEWSYPDRDSEKLRAIDVVGLKQLGADTDPVVARLAILVECKRSVSPYVFFRSATDRHSPDFPAVYGLGSRGINISVSGQGSSEPFMSTTLGLEEMRFVSGGPPLVSTFAKADVKSDRAVLSGEDVYSGILMPLIGAMNQASAFVVGWHSGGKKYPALTLGLCVLDAPMLVADARKRPHDLALTPWVRISRQEIITDAHPSERKVRFYAFDIVHLGFVPKFLDDHLLPFAWEYAERVKQMQDVIAQGGGTVTSKDWRWSDVKAK
jgi:hypothetical protein